jgi:hypothetical protein
VEFSGGLRLTRLAAQSIIIEMTVIVTVILWPNRYFWTRQYYDDTLLWDPRCPGI